MGSSLTKLLDISSPALSEAEVQSPLFAEFGKRGAEIQAMLAQRNGLYAMRSALHVFPCCSVPPLHAGGDIDTWNDVNTWKSHYAFLETSLLCFAEDIFGGQFCTDGQSIFSFDPETGETDSMADDLEGWAYAILDNYEYHTGFSLADAWQKKNPRLPIGKRLIPQTPFALNGEFDIKNLSTVDAVEGMIFRAKLANQIHELPDGETIESIVISDE